MNRHDSIMANYTNAQTALDSAMANDLVEEYEIGNGKRKVKRGSVLTQVNALARLEGMASRRSSGSMLRLAKLQEPSE